MANYEMYDFLDNETPDVTDKLDLNTIIPIGDWPEAGDKYVNIIEGYDRSEEKLILSDESRFVVPVNWAGLTRSEAGTLADLYHNTSKGCGIGKSFYLVAPTEFDGHTYVARFVTFRRTWHSNIQLWSANAQFKITGRKPD